MRPGEVAKLRVKDIDQGRHFIWLDETKNNTSRLVPLTDTAFREIIPHIAGRDPEEYVFHRGKELPDIYQRRPAQMCKNPTRRGRHWVKPRGHGLLALFLVSSEYE